MILTLPSGAVPLAALSLPADPRTLAATAGVLFGMALGFWLLWSFHLLRVLVWALALFLAVSHTARLVSGPGFSVQGDLSPFVGDLGGIAFLLGIGWLGRTPAKSRVVLLVVLGTNVVLTAVVASVTLLGPSGSRTFTYTGRSSQPPATRPVTSPSLPPPRTARP
jgi:hypothetical protein